MDLHRDSDGAVAVGERVGPYVVVGRLAGGAGGRLYLAERAAGGFEQRVALRVLPAAEGADAVRRFERERRILGRLVHPRIAQLLDGGIDARGRPYLAMEHVAGEPIDVWCDRHRLGVEARLRLVIDVAGALQAAHRSLVVHGDVEPANLLVTADGEVELVDFGVARVLDPESASALLSRTAMSAVGSTYASPEQFTGRPLTTATDVYQLGLVAYELVSGVRPQEGGETLAERYERVCRREPPPASRAAAAAGADSAARRGATPVALARRLRPDLDAVLARALAKAPEARYATPAELAADLERWLTRRPVTARPATLAYRAARWARRNRALVAAAAAVVVLTLGYTGAVTHQARVLDLQRQRAEVEARKAAEVERFVLDLFHSADPERASGTDLTVRDLLAEGVARVDRELADQPEVRARLLAALGEIHGELGLAATARELLERALALERDLGGDAATVTALERRLAAVATAATAGAMEDGKP